MSDIVERLRAASVILKAKPCEVYGLQQDCEQAADELQSLRGKVERLTKELKSEKRYWMDRHATYVAGQHDRDERAEAMRDRVRANIPRLAQRLASVIYEAGKTGAGGIATTAGLISFSEWAQKEIEREGIVITATPERDMCNAYTHEAAESALRTAKAEGFRDAADLVSGWSLSATPFNVKRELELIAAAIRSLTPDTDSGESAGEPNQGDAK